MVGNRLEAALLEVKHGDASGGGRDAIRSALIAGIWSASIFLASKVYLALRLRGTPLPYCT
jgi:hypothetical protein